MNRTSIQLAVILITHKLNEVMECADRITVLRQGRVAGEVARAEATESGLIQLMFERDLTSSVVSQRSAGAPDGPPVLELRQACSRDVGVETSLEEIDLTVHPGEIVGVAGVSGNGQKELGELILGSLACVEGRKRLFGEDFTHRPIGDARRAGVSYIPENPMAMALNPYLTVLQNMAITQTRRYARRGGLRIDWQAAESDAELTWERLGFRVPPYTLARSLSGGNQQRAVIARELSHDPRLIIASYLTHGLDVQSAHAARAALRQARDQGAGVLLISEDLEELFEHSDRLVVMHAGRIVGEFRTDDADIYEVGRLMTGSQFAYG